MGLLAYMFLVSGLPFGIKSNARSGIATPFTSIIRKYIVNRNRFRGGVMSYVALSDESMDVHTRILIKFVRSLISQRDGLATKLEFILINRI